LCARTTALIAHRANFVKKSRGFFCYLPISKYFSCIISTNRIVYVWLFQENIGTSVRLVFLVKFREEWTTQWARHNQCLLKLRRIIDCMTKQAIRTHCAYKYRNMIFFVSNYTCTMIPNDQIWYLKQVKEEPPRNPSTVFRVMVRALFEWQNRLKVAVAFVFVLDAFAFALCINRPLSTRRDRPNYADSSYRLSPLKYINRVSASLV